MYNPEIVCNRMINYRPPRIAMGLLLAAGVVEILIPAAWPHPQPVPIAGIVVAALGFLLMIRAWWLFRINDTAICPTADTTFLITGDVFALTRNPMYLGMVMIMLGVSLFVGGWPFYLVTIAYGLMLDAVFCRYEELKMRESFGSRYYEYAAKVRRWL